MNVHLGNQERDLHAGGTVFIPAYTWVNARNVGTETVSVVAVFQRPVLKITCGANRCCQTKNQHLSPQRNRSRVTAMEMSYTSTQKRTPNSEVKDSGWRTCRSAAYQHVHVHPTC